MTPALAALLPFLALTISGLSFLLTVFLLWRHRTVEKRLEAFFAGKDGQSLEQIFIDHGTTLTKHAEGIRDLVQASEYLHRAIQTSLRKVAFERYNPFPGVGGNQSFTLVLLDAFNSGVVITSLHNRESTRVYAKAIRNGKPLHKLSEEEHRAFQNALLLKGA
jgi:hypothetical protein